VGNRNLLCSIRMQLFYFISEKLSDQRCSPVR
jgi:hypothetical protein